MKSKFEVWVTVWSEENHSQIKRLAGTFDTFIDANLFAKAYFMFYSSHAEIVEYVRK